MESSSWENIEMTSFEEVTGFKEEFQSLVVQALPEELRQLKEIENVADSIQERLLSHYLSAFPKKCNTCGTYYASHSDFQQHTQQLKQSKAIFDEHGLQEYRNCPCGSTLLVISGNRRDESEWGKKRRELFEECLSRLTGYLGISETVISQELRKAFHM